MEINKIYNENCLDTMARMPDGFIDLTVTSPPYDNLRDYTGRRLSIMIPGHLQRVAHFFANKCSHHDISA
jgi:DNA modification methylase